MDNLEKRNSNIELLRIVLILMIIALHYFNSRFGGLLGKVEKNTTNYWISHFIESACIIAVNTFIIITGYFSCKKNVVNISKPIKLFSQMIFYGIVISLTIIIFTKTDITLTVIIEIILNSLNRWFVVIYCILYFLIPYINKLISHLTKKQYQILLGINIFFFYIWTTFFTQLPLSDGGYGIVNFITLYMIGSYIKIYKDDYISKKYSLLIYLICTLLTTIFSKFTERAWCYNSIFNLISCIFVFEFFKSLKIKNNKFINSISKYTFAIYIIHENSFLVNILYRKVFHSNLYWNSNFMILNLFISVIGIYIFCLIIEFIRRILLKRIVDDSIDKIKYQIE